MGSNPSLCLISSFPHITVPTCWPHPTFVSQTCVPLPWVFSLPWKLSFFTAQKILLIFPHSVHVSPSLWYLLGFFFFLDASGLRWGTRGLVPWPGIRPRLLHWKHRVLTTGPSRKSLGSFLTVFILFSPQGMLDSLLLYHRFICPALH